MLSLYLLRLSKRIAARSEDCVPCAGLVTCTNGQVGKKLCNAVIPAMFDRSRKLARDSQLVAEGKDFDTGTTPPSWLSSMRLLT